MPNCPRLVLMCLFIVPVWACAAPASQQTPAASSPMEEPESALEADPAQPEEMPVEPVQESLPSHTPDDLIGLEPKAIQDLLGPVSLKRWEGDAQVMQFANGQCVMDIYFYEAFPGGAFQASYLSARTPTGADVDAASCLTSLLP